LSSIYLDTHIVVWLYCGLTEKFSSLAKSLINSNDLTFSPIVRLELKYLLEIERITASPEAILTTLENNIGLCSCTKNFDQVVYQALTLDWTRDPFDRLITAQSALTDSLLLTKDQKILAHYDYARWS
jgi:PIN domain nuclease of toxin-antitoxin system